MSIFASSKPWVKRGTCYVEKMPTELFFDLHTTGRVQALRKVCAACPERIPCALDALEEEGSAPGGRYGFRGCLTPHQRRKLHRSGGLGIRDPKNIPLR